MAKLACSFGDPRYAHSDPAWFDACRYTFTYGYTYAHSYSDAWRFTYRMFFRSTPRR